MTEMDLLASLRAAAAQALLTARIADALERVAAALDRRDVADVREVFRPADVAEALNAGWIYLGPAANGEEGNCAIWHILGRPRNLPPGAKASQGGGQGE